MNISRKTKNFFFLGWAMGAVGFGAYTWGINPKKPTSITQKLLEDTALSNQTKQFQYQFKSRSTHLEEILNNDKNIQQEKVASDKESQTGQEQGGYDLIVIGGGCNGAGVFLDAASRGLKCLLLESNDFAAGTSSKSTKLIHGGIRYLEQVFEFSLAGDRLEKFDLVKEGLRERAHFVENAFYMTKSLPCVIPSTSFFQTAYFYIGTVVYHLIYLYYSDKDTSYRFNFPVVYGKEQLKSNFPFLDEKFKYGVVYWDGQFNDTRMNIDLLLTGTIDNYIPKMKGGNILNYAEVSGLIKNPLNQNVEGVEFVDKLTGKTHQVKGKVVCNCAGVFADDIRKMDNPNCGKRIISVGGSHLVLPKSFGSKKCGILIPKTSDGRVLFALPWQNHQLIGTTEKSYDKPELNPTVSFDEMLFMVQEISKIYPKIEVQEISSNIKSKWSGLRPLILENELKEGEKVDTKSIARKHIIERSQNNLFSLLGGKWTAYRHMGAETVDEICQYLKKEKGVTFEDKYDNSQTKFLRLSGEFIKSREYNFPQKSQYNKYYSGVLQDKYDFLDKIQSKYLIKTYGDRAFDLMKICVENPKMREKLAVGHPFIKAEVVYHIRNEMAIKPIDVIYRRTRMGFVDRVAIQESISSIVDIFATELMWDNKQKEKQLEETKALVSQYQF